MFTLSSVTEDYMVLAFLQAELNSGRWHDKVISQLKSLGATEELITAANLDSSRDNELRARVLDWRGYASRTGAFANWPTDVVWSERVFSRSEFAELQFFPMKFWGSLSEGENRPARAAEAVRLGRGLDRFNEWDMMAINAMPAIAADMDAGLWVPPIIVLGLEDGGPFVIFEGYTRAVAYFLAAADTQPPKVIVGLANFDHLQYLRSQ